MTAGENALCSEWESLEEQLKEQLAKISQLTLEKEELISELANSSNLPSEVSRLEKSLLAADDRIEDVLKVKEKYVEMVQENLAQTKTRNDLQEQVETLSFQS